MNALDCFPLRATARKSLPSILVLIGMMTFATSAMAAEAAFLNNLGEFICGIATFINTKYLFVAGLILIVIGAIGIASSESTIMKFISVVCIGIGLAAAAPSIMKVLGIASQCTGF
ncbi:TrbC/VirB2 family protein [Cupriavidus sp. AU9028]|uniref:TrbC/VirB2 family protein n=1 Tax=Cupriavidus sp. AU9028 TaxID=2871157 RepID=UPI001C970F26|nr:TrbC/VirB2 family protein [Cupriavidus sp. AU9028]MBY4898642.1 TrbC/VirB2 family protein [Cupriavidus sp. AU9028]